MAQYLSTWRVSLSRPGLQDPSISISPQNWPQTGPNLASATLDGRQFMLGPNSAVLKSPDTT